MTLKDFKNVDDAISHLNQYMETHKHEKFVFKIEYGLALEIITHLRDELKRKTEAMGKGLYWLEEKSIEKMGNVALQEGKNWIKQALQPQDRGEE